MNFIHLSGRIGADPEIIPYKTQTDTDGAERFLAKFDLAADPTWSARRSGNETPDWIPIIGFDGPIARFAKSALKKGDAVTLTGRLPSDTWEGEAGTKRKSLQVAIIEIAKNGKGTGDRSDLGGDAS